jgi:hypothetical protein
MATNVDDCARLGQAMSFSWTAADCVLDPIALTLFTQVLTVLAGWEEVDCLHLSAPEFR